MFRSGRYTKMNYRLGVAGALFLLFAVGLGGCEKSAALNAPEESPATPAPETQPAPTQVASAPLATQPQQPAARPPRPAQAPASEPAPEELISGIAGVIEEVYGLISGKTIDVIEVRNDPHLWRVVFRTRGSEAREQVVYVTRDGRYLIESIIDLPRRRDQLINDKRFATCLKSRGVHLFVDPKMPETRKQLEALGSFSKSLVINCAVAPENCKKLGVTSLPSVAMGSRMTPGFQTRAWVETLSGCK